MYQNASFPTNSQTLENEDEAGKTAVLSGNTRYERSLSLLRNQLYSDLTLEVTDFPTNVVKTYKVHKAVFAVVSPVWESSIRWTEDNVLKISGFPLDLVDSLIVFAYTNSICIDSIKLCLEIIIAADYYSINQLSIKCIDFISEKLSYNEINVDEFINIFNTASLLDVVKLIEYCIAYIQDIPCSVFDSDEFLNLSLKSILYIMRMNHYLFSEARLLRAVLRWSVSHCSDGVTLRQFLADNGILNHIRLRTIPLRDLVEMFNSFDFVFTDDEKSEIILSVAKDEPFPYDYLNSDSSPRGGINIIGDSEIIVLSPPLTVYEEFTYFGKNLSQVLLIESIEIEPRSNSFFTSFTGRYEESIVVKMFNGFEVKYDKIVNRLRGGPLIVPFRSDVVFTYFGTLQLEITLNNPGIYRLNSNFPSNSEPLVRFKKGIVRSINLRETQDT